MVSEVIHLKAKAKAKIRANDPILQKAKEKTKVPKATTKDIEAIREIQKAKARIKARKERERARVKEAKVRDQGKENGPVLVRKEHSRQRDGPLRENRTVLHAIIIKMARATT